MARYPTKQAVSAGGLVFSDRPEGRWVVLISRRNAAGALQWTLPKGRLERRENLEEAAIREVREETGLECAIVEKLGVIDYWFVWHDEGMRYHKFVHYYLMRYVGGDIAARDDEAEDVVWLSLDDAMRRLSFPNEQRLLAGATPAGGSPGPAGTKGSAGSIGPVRSAGAPR